MSIHSSSDIGHYIHVVKDLVTIRGVTLMVIFEEHNIVVSEGIDKFLIRKNDGCFDRYPHIITIRLRLVIKINKTMRPITRRKCYQFPAIKIDSVVFVTRLWST